MSLIDQYDWLAVRCCCQPVKVVGFLRLPRKIAAAQVTTIVDIAGQRHEIQIREMASYDEACRIMMNGGKLVSYLKGDVVQPRAELERAIYSEERPIDFWRRIPGFVEVGPPV
jgi:hypothetical protein